MGLKSQLCIYISTQLQLPPQTLTASLILSRFIQAKSIMDLVNRLKHYMDTSQVTISQFADRCGIPRPTMSQLMNGRNKRISDEVINKIHNAYPDLSIMWLMFGEGEMGLNKNIQISEPQNEQIPTDLERQSAQNLSVTNPESQFSPFTESTPNNLQAEISLFDNPQRDIFSTISQPNAATTENIANNNASTKSNISFESDTPTATIKSESSSATQINKNTIPSSSPQTNARTIVRDEPQAEYKRIAISPDAHKKITNIVVFYSDNSFQSFSPDSPQVRS